MADGKRKILRSFTKEDLDGMEAGDLISIIKAAQEEFGAHNVGINGTGVVRRADGSIKYDHDHPDHPDNVAEVERLRAERAAGDR